MPTRKPEPAPIEILLARSQAAFPEAKAMAVDGIEPLESWHNRMTAFTCELTDRPGSLRHVSLILREYFGKNESGQSFHEREWTAWRMARVAGVPVPEVIAYGLGEEGPYALMRRSPGRPLWPDATPALVAKHARILAKLHAFGLTDQDFHPLPHVTTTGRLEALRRISEEAEDSQLAHAVSSIVDALRPASEPSPRLLHGDSHPENVLTDGGEITCLVDWEGAYVGDPRWDVAHTFLWLDAAKRPDLADMFAQSYRDASDLDLGALPMWITAFETAMWANAAHLRMRMARGQPLPTTNIEGILREGDEAAMRVKRHFKDPVYIWASVCPCFRFENVGSRDLAGRGSVPDQHVGVQICAVGPNYRACFSADLTEKGGV